MKLDNMTERDDDKVILYLRDLLQAVPNTPTMLAITDLSYADRPIAFQLKYEVILLCT